MTLLLEWWEVIKVEIINHQFSPSSGSHALLVPSWRFNRVRNPVSFQGSALHTGLFLWPLAGLRTFQPRIRALWHHCGDWWLNKGGCGNVCGGGVQGRFPCPVGYFSAVVRRIQCWVQRLSKWKSLTFDLFDLFSYRRFTRKRTDLGITPRELQLACARARRGAARLTSVNWFRTASGILALVKLLTRLTQLSEPWCFDL